MRSSLRLRERKPKRSWSSAEWSFLRPRRSRGTLRTSGEFLREGTFPERKALIRNFVESIDVVGDEAELTYTLSPCRTTE